ncbi:MAG TPA: anti-sigma F factor antagonist [Syntrophomonas sp.]|nr:anti-sigma F factor antagonist [Syntrophomonas sp.]
MKIEFKQIRSTLVVKLTGEFDMLIAEKLRQEIDSRLDSKQVSNLIINLEKVTFIDSSGLGVIIGRYKKISLLQGHMYIVGASASVEKILMFSGINKLIPIYKNEQDIINI